MSICKYAATGDLQCQADCPVKGQFKSKSNTNQNTCSINGFLRAAGGPYQGMCIKKDAHGLLSVDFGLTDFYAKLNPTWDGKVDCKR